MGFVATITKDKFPNQSSVKGKRVRVFFHYDSSETFEGVCIRDDREVPWVTIFQLDNGNVVLATECQYSYSP